MGDVSKLDDQIQGQPDGILFVISIPVGRGRIDSLISAAYPCVKSLTLIYLT